MKRLLSGIVVLLTTLIITDECRADDTMPLWDNDVALPAITDIPILNDVRFAVIKPYEFNSDGYRFLHGVGLCFHNEKLYASIGHNRGGENTDTEEARFCISDDDGRTWTDLQTIDASPAKGIGVSHGVFLSHEGKLWALHGAYTGTMQDVHTRAYCLNESTQTWESRGPIIHGGFWPLGEPQQMENGNWIISGFCVTDANPAAVAISHGDDLLEWDLIVIPQSEGLGKVWGESAVIVDGASITNIARWGAQSRALVATSEDFGQTWTPSAPSNLPMAASKPCAGTLSTGQRYMICSSSADGGNRRSPLTIAISRPGESQFSRVFVIRHAEFPGGPGESHPKAALSYACSTEHDGKLYVGYSNNGGNVGRVGQGRELWNNNSAELAVIAISDLKVDP